MFLFQAGAFLAELERLEPELLAHCRAAVAAGKQDLDFFRLDAAAFAKAPLDLDRLCRDGAHRQGRGGAGPDGLERYRLLGFAVERHRRATRPAMP